MKNQFYKKIGVISLSGICASALGLVATYLLKNVDYYDIIISLWVGGMFFYLLKDDIFKK